MIHFSSLKLLSWLLVLLQEQIDVGLVDFWQHGTYISPHYAADLKCAWTAVLKNKRQVRYFLCFFFPSSFYSRSLLSFSYNSPSLNSGIIITIRWSDVEWCFLLIMPCLNAFRSVLGTCLGWLLPLHHHRQCGRDGWKLYWLNSTVSNDRKWNRQECEAGVSLSSKG